MTFLYAVACQVGQFSGRYPPFAVALQLIRLSPLRQPSHRGNDDRDSAGLSKTIKSVCRTVTLIGASPD